MANVIRTGGGGSVELTGNAQPSDVLKGSTFYNNSEIKQTGTLELVGNAAPSDVASGKTFYNTNAKAIQTGTLPVRNAGNGEHITVWNGNFYICKISEGIYKHSSSNATSPEVLVPASLLGDAHPTDVLTGKTFSSHNGAKINGTMTNRGSWGTTINPGGSISIPGGYHNGQGVVRASSTPSQGVLQAMGLTNVPSGNWNLRTGTLSLGSLNGSTYIPLSAHIRCDWTHWPDSFTTRAITDNRGTNYGATGTGGNNSEANPRCYCETDIDLINKNGRNCSALLGIRSFNGVESAHICTWLEKVGGVVKQLLSKINHFFEREVVIYG